MDRTYDRESRAQVLNFDQALMFAKDHCKYLKKRGGTGIYRGNFKTNQYLLYTPENSQARMSANTQNYMTLLMDNLPSWSLYPKRSKGLICSTNIRTAKDYGSNTYHVIPSDGTSIGVCSDVDVWDSFPNVDDKLHWNDVSTFNYNLEDLCDELGYKLDESNWQNFSNTLKKITPLDAKEYSKKYSKSEIRQNLWKILESFESSSEKNLLDFIAKIVDPKLNKFSLMKAGTIIPQNREVWMSGPTLFISFSSFDHFLTNLTKA